MMDVQTKVAIVNVIVTGLVGLVSVAAIFRAPILALKLQKSSEEQHSQAERQLQLFRTLMTYRATPLSVPFVQALNSIDLEFRANNERDKAIRSAWTSLLDHFSNGKGQPDFDERSKTLTITLLREMSKALGYDFDETYLRRHSYYPLGHGSIESEQHELRRLMLNVLRGHGKLPVAVFEEKFGDFAPPENP